MGCLNADIEWRGGLKAAVDGRMDVLGAAVGNAGGVMAAVGRLGEIVARLTNAGGVCARCSLVCAVSIESRYLRVKPADPVWVDVGEWSQLLVECNGAWSMT